MFKRLRYDIRAIRERDPAARNSLEVLLLYSGLHAVIHHRWANFFDRHKWFFMARMISQMSRHSTGIEIHPGATIGKGLFIDHGMGVIIGETTVIGDDCTSYQGVTLGGTGKDKGKRHPTLGNNVMVGSGAKVLGPFTVGDGAKIAAGAVVLSEVAPGATAVGVPAKAVVRKEKVEAKQDLDQVHIPDPVSQEFSKLKAEIEALKQELNEIKQKENIQ